MLRADTHITDGLQLIRAEYLEIPGLSLTMQQVQRLWGLDLVTTEAGSLLRRFPVGAARMVARS